MIRQRLPQQRLLLNVEGFSRFETTKKGDVARIHHLVVPILKWQVGERSCREQPFRTEGPTGHVSGDQQILHLGPLGPDLPLESRHRPGERHDPFTGDRLIRRSLFESGGYRFERGRSIPARVEGSADLLLRDLARRSGVRRRSNRNNQSHGDKEPISHRSPI